MNSILPLPCLAAALLALAALATPLPMLAADDGELERLRRENARLQHALDELGQHCAVAQAAVTSVPAPAGAATTVGGAQPSATTAPSPVTVAPPGYKLVKVEPTEPYADAGCDRGANSRDPRWKRKYNWEGLGQGMAMPEVEELLGVEHHDLRNGERIGWEYGKCGLRAHGTVVFQDGKVTYWTPPTF